MENTVTKEDFITFLKYKQYDISNISHISKTNEAHDQFRDIIREIDYKCVHYYHLSWDQLKTTFHTKNLALSADILDQYSYKGSDKRKKEIIDEFKTQYLYESHIFFRSKRRLIAISDFLATYQVQVYQADIHNV